MGNQEALPLKIESLRAESWIQAGQDQQNTLFSNVNPYRRRLLANIITHELIEEYELNFISEQDYNNYIAELSERQLKKSSTKDYEQENFIYPVRYFVNKTKHQMCTTIHTGYLYAEKVDLRLKQINDIPFGDLLCLYKGTLWGFRRLFEKAGYFDIVEQMIFISRHGEVRVWMNANLAKNYPNYQKNNSTGSSFSTTQQYSKNQHRYGSQAEMIRKLILMIQKNSDQFAEDNQGQQQLFSQYLEYKKIFDKLSFEDAIQEFKLYINKHNLYCPRYMKSIPELFTPDEIFQDNPTQYEQSRVNEITSQHLTNMKKKYLPMETIVEDEKYPSQTTNVPIKNQNHKLIRSNQPQFSLKQKNIQPPARQKQTKIPSYTPVSTPHMRDLPKPTYERHTKNVAKIMQSPLNQVNQSRSSQQTHKHSHQDRYLKQSSHSSSIHSNQTHKNFSYNLPNPQIKAPIGLPIYTQTHMQSEGPVQGQKVVVHNGYVGPNYSQLQYFPNPDLNQKFIVAPSQTSFYTSPPINNGIKTIHTNIVGYNNTNTLSEKISPAQSISSRISQAQSINNRSSPSRPSKEEEVDRYFLTSNRKQNDGAKKIKKNDSINTKNQNGIVSLSRNRKSFSRIGEENQRSEKEVEQEKNLKSSQGKQSKIKYFTAKGSYQLDDQIANDLQKFLGLKVN